MATKRPVRMPVAMAATCTALAAVPPVAIATCVNRVISLALTSSALPAMAPSSKMSLTAEKSLSYAFNFFTFKSKRGINDSLPKVKYSLSQ